MQTSNAPDSWDEADQLITLLRSWGINYLVGLDHSADPAHSETVSPITLIQRLAQCKYPRVRDASISLFLLHPEIAPAALEAIQISEPAVAEQIATLILATLYLQRLWSLRLTMALGHEPSFPEHPFTHLWQNRHLPPPAAHNGTWGLLALQEAEQKRTGLPFTFTGDWQNQLNHLLLQEEPHHPSGGTVGPDLSWPSPIYRPPLLQPLKEHEQPYIVEDIAMSMRPSVDKQAIELFLTQLGRNFRKPGRLYLMGSAALVYYGVRPGTTVDIDVEISGNDEGEMIDAIRQLIRQLNINVEFASPGDFMPLPTQWMTQSEYIGCYGEIDAFYFDFYSIALSKMQRGNTRDINDVKLLLEQGVITLQELDTAYKEVLVQVGKGSYARLDPQRFAERYTAVWNLL